MDWSRAKTILIYSFLLLNLMLGYELWANEWDFSLSRSEAAVITEEMQRIMESKGIRIDTAIPKEVPKLREIVAAEEDSKRKTDTITLSPPIKYTRGDGKGMPTDALRRAIGNFSQYQLDPILTGSGRLVMNQMFGSFPIFEMQLVLWVEDGRITAYRQDFSTLESNLNGQEQKVISAHTAVRSLLENYLPDGAVIRDIRLGYRGRYQLLLPSWRITLADGSIYYVNAFTGAVEAP